MFKECDECGKSFDIFNEGNVSDDIANIARCGTCWRAEAKRRGII
jgi:hypothetical protein